jgi:hypothetical protein
MLDLHAGYNNRVAIDTLDPTLHQQKMAVMMVVVVLVLVMMMMM